MELEEMKEKWIDLSKQLDHHKLLNERLLKNAFEDNIHKHVVYGILNLAIIVISFPILLYKSLEAFSLGLQIYIYGVLLLSALWQGYMLYLMLRVRSNMQNLKQCSFLLAKLTRKQRIQTGIGLLLGVVFAVWFIIEFAALIDNNAFSLALVIVLAVVVVVAVIIGELQLPQTEQITARYCRAESVFTMNKPSCYRLFKQQKPDTAGFLSFYGLLISGNYRRNHRSHNRHNCNRRHSHP